MTPEELSGTIEFIIASQARLAAAQEQDRQDRIEFQEWSKGLNARMTQLLVWQSQLLDTQSQRMDRQDKFYQDSLKLQERALHLLNLILDRLPSGPFPQTT